MKYIPIFLIVLFLVGCGSFRAPTIIEHKVLVTVPCKITPPDKPLMPFTNSAKKTDSLFVKTKKILAEIEIRKGYETELEAAVRSCQ